MFQGIAIFGQNGGGKSTLAHALAKRIDYFEMDVEDYYFPEQKESRKWALENSSVIATEHLGELPFSNPRTKSEVQAAILEDIKAHPKFILSGVTMNWSEDILSRIDIAFWVQTPLEERLKRIQEREERRFGARVLAGGDMFEQQIEFRKVVENRDSKAAEDCAMSLIPASNEPSGCVSIHLANAARVNNPAACRGVVDCPVIVLDGTLPVEENLEKITGTLEALYLVWESN